MSFYPYDPNRGQEIQGAPGTRTDRGFVTHETWADPAAAAGDSIVDGNVPGTVSASVLAAGDLDAQPDYARALSAVGSNASVAGTVAIEGANVAGATITEDIVLNGTVTVDGSVAFASVSQITIPAQSDAAYEVDIGTTDKLGLISTLPHDTVLAAYLDNARQSTLPTLATNATLVHLNTVDLDSALNGDQVDVYYLS